MFQYGGAVVFTALLVFLRWLLDPVLGDYLPFITIYGAVAFGVWAGGFGPAVVAAIVGYVACDFLFIQPRGSFDLGGLRDYVGLGLYLLSCSIIIGLGEGMRTARKEAIAKQLRYAQLMEQIHTVTESMDVPVTRCSRDLHYLWVSKPYADWIGRPVEEIVGRPIPEVVGPDAFKRLEPHFQQVLLGEKVKYEEIVNFARIGPRCISATYTPTRAANGRVDGWVAVVVDVTEQKRLEQNLKDADRHKDEFLAMLAHELRNPLSPIRNAIELQKMAGDDSTLVEESRAIMERQVEQLVHLVDDLMEMSRIKAGKLELHKELVRHIDIIQQAVEVSQPLIDEKQQTLDVSAGPVQVVVEADAVRLAQVYSNLLTNSAKYTERNGHISLTVALEGSDVIVSVADNGIGIPKEMLPSIFDMFAQAEKSPGRTQGGLGIGLSVAKQIVEMHGGRIDARSEGPGKGSEFSVRLPVAVSQQAVQKNGEDQSHEKITSLPRRRILIVDDMRESAQILANLLGTRGQDVSVVVDGASALEVAVASRPEIVFIDLGMPGMNGYEVAQRLRARSELGRTVLVALTGYIQEEARHKAFEAGFDKFLLKPAGMKELEEIVLKSAKSSALP